MIPTEMRNLLENFTTDEQFGGFNQTYESTDDNASFHFRHWLKSDDELRVRVYVADSISNTEHKNYISEFTAFLSEFGFETVTDFEEIEDEYAEFQDKIAYQTTVTNPQS